jgi:purine-nucleoside phosphorylase
MTWVKHNIRLSPAQDRTLIRYAEQRGLTRYKMLGRVVDHGLAVVESGISAPSDARELADEIAALGVRFVELERVLDRALFTACAGYSYARQAALGGRCSDEAITAEAIAAYERQRSLASVVAS